MFLRIIALLMLICSFGTAQQIPENYELTPAGKFNQISNYDRISENGIYSCTFKIISAGDEIRELGNFIFMKNGVADYNLESVPGSDLYISNSGIAAFIDHKYHFKQQITINFYSPEGVKLSSHEFRGAYLFGFSHDGDIMGVGTPGKLTLIYIKDNKSIEYPGCMAFDISDNGKYVVLAGEEDISVYSGSKLMYSKPIAGFVRKINIINDSSLCYITRNLFEVSSLVEDKSLFSSSVQEGLNYSDLLISNAKILIGLNKREVTGLSGYIIEYTEKHTTPPLKVSEKIFNSKPTGFNKEFRDSVYDPIPWPFSPFDSMRTAWNHYEQHMGLGGLDSYLHQGLDLIVPINEPTYNVQQGIVKCVLTIGGSSYWRVAVSPVQEPGRSDGWLYAHLVEPTIPVFTGDTVDIHEFLGNIIVWSSNWGHIHFVQINDSGLVWLYSDNEWGINFNPYLALNPLPDNTPPEIQNSSTTQKFEFCKNETSVYLSPDSLYGKIDIVIKVVDYIGESEWQQPAFKSYYWIKSLAVDSIVYPRKLGHILNHPYPFYDGGHYEVYAKILYKLDAAHPASSWGSTTRNYYHILTNNNGDELLDTTEKHLALDTELFEDGYYRIFVEVYDPAGNSALDSMDVMFVNGVVSVEDNILPTRTILYQNYPNPFNAATVIRYELANPGRVSIKLYDLLGREIVSLADEYQDSGKHQINFNSDYYNLSSGTYFYKIKTSTYSSVKKLILLK